MEKQLPRVGEIWKGRVQHEHYIIITKYIEDRHSGDMVEYEIIKQNHESGIRFVTAVMNYCDPVSYYNTDSGVWVVNE